MQLLLLGLALGIFLHDAGPMDLTPRRLSGWWVAVVVVTPKVWLGAAYWWACRAVMRRVGSAGVGKSLRRVNRWSAALPIVGLLLFGLDLYVGWLGLIRGSDFGASTFPGPGLGAGIGGPRDWILLDEVAAMLPTLLLVGWSWWAYYPLDRRLKEVSILRRADAGLPIYPIWTRGQYVLTQARNQLALILAPLLLIMAWSETLVNLYDRGWIDARQQLWLTPVGAVVVFLVSPWMMKRLWDTVSLPPGPVREKMEAMCRRHGVRVADLLLWRTFGGMINAAVMGFFAPVRYILLSDGLLDQVPEHEVEAVMAHELAHVRLRHLWWLLIGAAAGAAGLSWLGEAVIAAVGDAAGAARWWIEPALLAGSLGGWVVWFGYVSRRIERQADTFAARHMQATMVLERADVDYGTFGAGAVSAMVHALQRVADLNHIAPRRRSWRHGSIAWRQGYLRSLVGRPLARPSVDVQLGWIKLGSVGLLLAYAGWAWLG